MERMNPRRIVWMLHRLHLRHGPLVWVAAALMVVALAAGATTLHQAIQVRSLRAEWKRVRALPAPPIADATSVAKPHASGPHLPLPDYARRFDVTDSMLEAIRAQGLDPDRIRFRFEPHADAGITRQVATFSVRARWPDVAGVLQKLQASRRDLYVSGLRIARESPEAETVTADIRIAAAYMSPAVAGSAP